MCSEGTGPSQHSWASESTAEDNITLTFLYLSKSVACKARKARAAQCVHAFEQQAILDTCARRRACLLDTAASASICLCLKS
jgi:hypothetical protein